MDAGGVVPEQLARAGVTARQAETFWLIADRLSNREIAERLVISVRTVESHVAALLRKLAAADRSELVALAADLRSRRRRPLPRPIDSFLGRDRELEDLRTVVATRRLVTLVGPPGAGKSRLALELARAVQTQPPAVFVDLAAVRSDRDVAQAFLDGLGVARTGRDAGAALGEALAAADVWLVVDNCEHVGDTVAALLHDVLTSTDAPRVLATSQRPLNVAGELVFPVGPLAVPPDDVASAAELLASPAGRLFVDRAGLAAPDVDVTAAPAAVAELCRRLDGLPLAIELAAARLRTFTPQELLARLEDRVAVLADGPHAHVSRHRTLEAAIAWSYDLLGDVERSVLQRVSVFPGEFGYDDVIAVVAGSGLSADNVARVFLRLVDRSLISRRHPPGEVVTTYRLLDSIRAFASGRLDAADPHGETRRRHALHFLTAAAEAGPALLDAGQAESVAWLERHWNDLRQSVRWALANARYDLAWCFFAGIGRGWDVLDIRGEVFGWLDDLLAAGLPDDDVTAVEATSTAALLLDYQDGARALELAERAVAMADRLGADLLRGRARIVLGWICARRLEATRAETELGLALDLLPGDGHDWDRAWTLQALGRAAPDLEPALSSFAASAELFAEIGDAVKHANVRYMMAMVCLERGERLDDARQWLTTAQHLASQAGSVHEQLHAAVQLARIDQLQGAPDAARDSLRELLPAFRRSGDHRCAGRCLQWLGEIELEQGATGQAARLLTESAAIATDLQAVTQIAAALRRLAEVVGRQGRDAEAARLLRTVDEMLARQG